MAKNSDKLSILGYGCMRFPTKMMAIDEEKVTQQIRGAIDRGVNYIDTAYPYHRGKSESFLGKALKDGYREKIKLATKLPHWMTDTKEEMHNILQEQLDKLQTDHIDYYLIHALNGPSWNKAKQHGVIEFLNEALEKKKIINAGFSFHGELVDFKRIVDDYNWTFCQIQYNILDTHHQAGTEGLKYASSKGLAIAIMEPLRGGHLAKDPPKAIKKIYESSGKEYSPAEWCLRWIWNHPEVTVVLSGMNDDTHIDQNIKAASNARPNGLSENEVETLDKVAKKYRELMPIGCTGCNYCMPCPHGVNIPGCFNAYNTYHMFNKFSLRFMYLFMHAPLTTNDSSLASQCVECGVCENKCPQHLPIRKHLKSVKNEMEGYIAKPAIWFLKKTMRKKRR